MDKTKTVLRQSMLKRREAVAWLERQGNSHQAAQLLQQLEHFRMARTMLVYLPFRQELDTVSIIKTAWQLQKIVAVPVCKPSRQLLLSRLNSMSEVEEGTFGIPEPLAQYIRPVPAEEVDLAVLPGVAFDLAGNRLGFGAGYFDRFLPLLRPDCPRLALAYEFQIVDGVPAAPHDIKMDLIVTEKRIIYC